MVTSEPGKYAMAATATPRKHRGLGILGMGNRGFLWIYDDFIWFLCGFYVENMGCSEGFWEDFMNLMFWKAGTAIVESWTFSESSSVMDKSETVEMGCRPNNWSWQCWQFQGGVLVQHIFLHISSNWAGNKQSLDLKTWKCSSPQKGLGWFLARVLPRRTRSAPSWWAKQREKQDQWTRIQRLQTSRTQRGITTQIKIKSISNSESYESCILEVIGIKTNSREDIGERIQTRQNSSWKALLSHLGCLPKSHEQRSNGPTKICFGRLSSAIYIPGLVNIQKATWKMAQLK